MKSEWRPCVGDSYDFTAQLVGAVVALCSSSVTGGAIVCVARELVFIGYEDVVKALWSGVVFALRLCKGVC